MNTLHRLNRPLIALFATLTPLLLTGCLGLSDGSELIPAEASGAAPTRVQVSKGQQPTYSWRVGNVSSLFVVRTADPLNPVWGINAQGAADIIPSPQVHGTTSFTDPNLQLMSAAETTLTNGVEYRVCITAQGGFQLFCTSFIPPDGTSVPLTTPGNSLAAGAQSMALTADGTAWRWGAGATAPSVVSGLGDAAAIAGGGGHSLAVTVGGAIWAWGANASGQLGDGSLADSAQPVRVANLPDVIAVAAGENHSLALDNDGRVWAWGDNGSGQLGDGTTINRNTPVQVPGLSNVTAIAAGKLHSMALAQDGTVWAWGGNYNGQLGDGTVANSTVPVRVGKQL